MEPFLEPSQEPTVVLSQMLFISLDVKTVLKGEPSVVRIYTEP